jgi:hypothetical protein
MKRPRHLAWVAHYFNSDRRVYGVTVMISASRPILPSR